ncbi:MAG: hypothetical protein ACFE0I_08835 [Elainellaceae cyanobacterium]
MTPVDIEVALRTAFNQCESLGYPLNSTQKQTITDAIIGLVRDRPDSASVASNNELNMGANTVNPLDELSPDQRRALLQYIQYQNQKDLSWKTQLLNDWLGGRESGSVQFIRDSYGPQWLERVQPYHIEQYSDEASFMLSVGDRIEVSNSLWEWVQEVGPCSQEWIPCQVVSIKQQSDDTKLGSQAYSCYTSCTIRFDSGLEYEIQGIYEWNRYNWRWLPS